MSIYIEILQKNLRKNIQMNNIIVFLHGFLGHPEEFKPIISNFKNPTESIAINLYESPSYSLKSMGEFVLEKLKILNITKAHIWGYSMGGRVSLELYRQSPELFKSLTLESTSLGIIDPKERSNRLKMDEDWINLLKKDQKVFLEKWYSQVLFHSFNKHPDFNEHLKSREMTVTADLSNIIKMLKEASPGTNPHHFDVIEDIKVPTLALVGQFDEKYVLMWAKLIDKNSNIAIKVIQNSGHVIHLEQPQEATLEFEKFVSQIN